MSCCPCIRTGTCSKCACRRRGCRDCKNPRCMHKRTQEIQNSHDFPCTPREAVDNGLKILKDMEWRSVRGAYMAYRHSEEYEKQHFRLSVCVTVASAILSLGFKEFILSFLKKPTSDGLGYYILYNLPFFVVAICVMYLKICPEYILPLYIEKFEKYNRAGAGWQKLKFRISGFRATTIRDEISPTDVQVAIEKFAEERRKVCEIARPEEKMHKACEEDPSLFRKRRDKLGRGYMIYWGLESMPITPRPSETFTQRCINVPLRFIKSCWNAFF